MKPYDGEMSQCPCCKECVDCNTGFQKVVDLKNAGLVIYRHTTRTEDLNKDTGIIEFATKTTEDVFILHNTNDMDITSADYLPEIEENKIKCPRCRKIIDHALKLLKKGPTINRNDVKGICEHCRTKDAPCFECKEVVKKFVANRTERTDYKKERVQHWLSKIKYLLKDAVVDNDTGRRRAKAHSELSIDQLCRVSPELGRELEVKQMFPSDSTNFVGAFPPSIEKRKKMFAHFPKLEKLEHPVVFIDAPETLERPSTFRPSAGFITQDRDKVYGSDVDSDDLKAMFRPPLTEEEKQVKAKKVESIPLVPFQSEEDFKSGKIDSITSFERILHLNKNEEIEMSKNRYVQSGKVSHRSEVPQLIAKQGPLPANSVGKQRYLKEDIVQQENNRSLSSMKSTKGTHGTTGETPNKIRKYHSEEALLTTIVGVRGEMIKQDFNYVFPKILSPGKKLKRQKSSSELIKDTQDMLQAKAEEEKKRLEKEQKKKLEEEEKQKLAREEKRKKLDAKKNAEAEIKHLEKVQKKNQGKAEEAKSDTGKKDTGKKDEKEKLTTTASTATSKSKRKDSPKESKPKEPKPTEPKAPKEPKELKQPKEPKEPKVDKNALKADKDAEKSKKEQEKREKEERLKKEKEERLTKEKEEKERLKKEKEDQLRKEKERKEKEMDLNAREKGKDDKLKKEKEAAAAKQKELDKAKQDKLDAEKRDREDAKNKLRNAREDEANIKPETEKPKVAKKIEEPGTKDLNIKSIKVRKPTADDLILQLVKLKQSDAGRIKPKRLSDLNLTSKDVKNHKVYHKNQVADTCVMCTDSDIELDAESLDAFKEEAKIAEMILGPKIFKYKPPLIDKQEEQNVPILFQSTFDDTKLAVDGHENVTSPHVEQKRFPVPSGKQAQKTEQEVPKGVIRYALSDRTFIDKGWTMLPTEKVVRKMNVYRMRPAHPEFDWFEHNKNKRCMLYDTGEKLAEFDDNGRGRWFYRNGRMALDYYDAEELNAQQRFVIYSSGQPDERGRAQPYTLLATFDYLGNGIVFDHGGKIRLKYNQTEGVVLDRSIGPVSHWKWHTLNDPPVLQQVMIDTQMAHKDPDILKLGGPHDGKARPDNDDMLAIEFDNFIKEKSKKLSQSFKPFQIKMKALKINEYFSLKVLDQATVYLIYRDGTTSLKLNIGMVLDHKEIVDTDTAEVGEVSNNMERLPARTDSLAGLQKSIAHAQHYDRLRTERELRIRPTMSCGSADRLVSAASRPLRPPLRAGPPCTTTADCYSKCSRKPSANNLYYDTRLC